MARVPSHCGKNSKTSLPWLLAKRPRPFQIWDANDAWHWLRQCMNLKANSYLPSCWKESRERTVVDPPGSYSWPPMLHSATAMWEFQLSLRWSFPHSSPCRNAGIIWSSPTKILWWDVMGNIWQYGCTRPHKIKPSPVLQESHISRNRKALENTHENTRKNWDKLKQI